MLRHSLMNENARTLPVGALATYALRILNSTALTRSTVSPEESAVVFTTAYRAASLDFRLTRVAILSKFFNVLSARYLSTLLGLKSESFRPRLEHAKPRKQVKPDLISIP